MKSPKINTNHIIFMIIMHGKSQDQNYLTVQQIENLIQVPNSTHYQTDPIHRSLKCPTCTTKIDHTSLVSNHALPPPNSLQLTHKKKNSCEALQYKVKIQSIQVKEACYHHVYSQLSVQAKNFFCTKCRKITTPKPFPNTSNKEY